MTPRPAPYRLAITRIAPASPAQASSAYRLFAPGVEIPVAFAACLFGDADGARAEAEGRAAAARHARAPAMVEVEWSTIDAADHAPMALIALAALTADLDALQARVKAAYPTEVTCRRGCDACCHQRVGVSRVEAARVAATIAALSPAARTALAATAARSTDACGALDADGGCQIYAGRPVVCRSHGLVHGPTTTSPGRSLPVLQRTCALNFGAAMPAAADVYDPDLWSERLFAIDAAFSDEVGVGAAPAVGRALALDEVLARLLPSLTSLSD